MKKPFYKNIFFWLAVIICASSGTLFAYLHRARPIAAAAMFPSPELMSSVTNAAEGYSFRIPERWYADTSATDSVTIYPDYSPDASKPAVCKIEMSVFPYSSSTDSAGWISSRLGSDPTIDVSERSSGNVSVGNSSGVEWTGTIDGMPTTLVYAFSDDHAYEIAPSVVNETAAGAGQCDDSLDIFLKNLTLK